MCNLTSRIAGHVIWLIVGLLVWAAAIPVWAADSILLRAADSYPVDYPTTAGLLHMKEYLETKSEGRIQIILYPDGELGSERETIEMTKIGALDIARVSAIELAEFSEAMELFSLPYLFRNDDHLWAVLRHELGRRLLDELAGIGLVGLCFYDAGARGFYTIDRPISVPQHLRGLKIRTPHSRVIRDMLLALGAIPTQMALSEVYSALQLGVIDGAEETLTAYYARGHYQRARYYAETAHARVPHVVIMSAQTWDKLSAQDQYMVRRAAEESALVERKLWWDLEAEARTKLQEAGVTIIPIPTETQILFLKSFESVRRRYRQHNRETMIQVIPEAGGD